MTQVLYTSDAVSRKVKEIMKDDQCERVVVVAFVGKGAESYIGNPWGLQLICWPQPGSTNPETLKLLIKEGAIVHFCDKLHMKVYWSEKHGTVLTSANLTNNGLGYGNLIETGAFFKPSEFNVSQILDQLHLKVPTTSDFLKLEIAHQEKIRKFGNTVSYKKDFNDWITQPFRSNFKLAVYETSDEPYPAEVIIESKKHSLPEPDDSFACYRNDFQIGNWVLIIETRKGKIIKNTINWLNVQSIVKVSGDKDFKYRALQFLPLLPEQPPFKLTNYFKDILYKQCVKLGSEKINESRSKPVSNKFINELRKLYLF